MATEVDRLVVVFDANFQRMEEKLNKVIRSNYAAAKKIETSWSGAGKAGLDDFTSSLTGAASSLPGLGSALGALGPPALAASAAVGALTLAFQGAVAAVEYADDIGDTADRLHVTTDALQEYRYAIRLAGGDTKGADEALEKFSVNLGKAKEGLAKPLQAFHAIGIEPAQIKSFKDTDEALRAVVKQMEGLSTAEKDAVIQQFGLEGLKQLIDDGSEAMGGLLDAAKATGVVMDKELIERAGKINDEFETAHTIISVQLKSALVDLAPVISMLLGLMAQFAVKVAEIVDGFREIDKKTSRGLETEAAGLRRQATRFDAVIMSGRTLGPAQQFVYDKIEKRLSEVNAELADRRAKSAVAEAAATDATKGLIAKTKAATKAKAVRQIGMGPAPIESFDPNAPPSAYDQIRYNRMIAESGNDLKDAKPFDFEGLITPEDRAKVLKRAEDALHDGVYAGIRGGLEAGFKDGLPGVLKYLQTALEKSVLDSVAEGLTSALLKGTSGGMTSGIVGAIASIFGPKGYASGTMSSRSGMALVGEHGPELVSLPGGSRVMSNSALRNMAMGGGRGVTQTVVFDNRGAVIWEQAARQMMSYADRAAAGSATGAVQIARKATPSDLARDGSRRLGR